MQIYDTKHEEQLVKSATGGNHAAFGELYDAHYERILRYCLRRTGVVAVAEDMTSEVFMKAWRSIGSFRPRGVPFGAWLYKIATNEIRMYYRSGKYRTVSLDELCDEQGYEPVSDSDIEQEAIVAQELVESKQQFQYALQLIQQLPLKYQEVLTLRYVEHKKLTEIATITGRKVGTVKSLLSRGIAKLRGEMQPSASYRITRSEDLLYKQSPERNV